MYHTVCLLKKEVCHQKWEKKVFRHIQIHFFHLSIGRSGMSEKKDGRLATFYSLEENGDWKSEHVGVVVMNQNSV